MISSNGYANYKRKKWARRVAAWHWSLHRLNHISISSIIFKFLLLKQIDNYDYVFLNFVLNWSEQKRIESILVDFAVFVGVYAHSFILLLVESYKTNLFSDARQLILMLVKLPYTQFIEMNTYTWNIFLLMLIKKESSSHEKMRWSEFNSNAKRWKPNRW